MKTLLVQQQLCGKFPGRENLSGTLPNPPPPKLSNNECFSRKMIGERNFLVGIFRAGSGAGAVAVTIHQMLDFGENGWWRLLQNCQEKIIGGIIIYGMLLCGVLGTRDRPGPFWGRKIGLNLISSRCFLQLRWGKMCTKGDLFQYLFTLIS